MILPNKNIITSRSLLGLGSIILDQLKKQESVSSLWVKVRGSKINTFQKFILVLDFLYTLNLIDKNNNLIYKKNDKSN